VSKIDTGLTIEDYERSFESHRALVREIDIILCGKDAAPQASLCDLVSPIQELKSKYDALVKENEVLKESVALLSTELAQEMLKRSESK